jgi:hypothetical protein
VAAGTESNHPQQGEDVISGSFGIRDLGAM